jgi:hypothetical protein
MAEETRSTANLIQRTSANSVDRIVILSDPTGNAATATIALSDLYGVNTVGQAISITTPASSTSLLVKPGNFLYDGNTLYLAIANNVVRRVGSLSTF